MKKQEQLAGAKGFISGSGCNYRRMSEREIFIEYARHPKQFLFIKNSNHAVDDKLDKTDTFWHLVSHITTLPISMCEDYFKIVAELSE